MSDQNKATPPIGLDLVSLAEHAKTLADAAHLCYWLPHYGMHSKTTTHHEEIKTKLQQIADLCGYEITSKLGDDQ